MNRAAPGLFLTIALLLASCSALQPPDSDGIAKDRSPLRRLAGARVVADRAAFELAVLPVDPAAADSVEALWRTVDAQAVDLPTRQRLDANGLRVGVTGSRVPDALTTMVKWTEPLAADGEVGDDHRSLADFPQAANRFESRLEELEIAEESWVPCSEVYPELAWTTVAAGQTRTGFCEQAQLGFAVRLREIRGGEAVFEIRPEIHFGQSRMRYEVGGGEFVYRNSQDRLPLDDAAFTLTLRAGQTLVLGSTGSGTGLGHQIFGSLDNGSSEAESLLDSESFDVDSFDGLLEESSGHTAGYPYRLFLVRPVNVPDDQLFRSTGRTRRRLATSLD